MLSVGAAKTIGSSAVSLHLGATQSLATLNPASAVSPTAGETLRAGRFADAAQK